MLKTTPSIYYFHAPWCAPCKTLGPIVERVVDATGGEVGLVKIDIEQNPGIANKYHVSSVPVLMAVLDGRLQEEKCGSMAEAQVRALVNRLLNLSRGLIPS